MGFFSKVFKKVKKGFKSFFKSIGKGIKKVFKGFGKFMGKIGLVGQLAMSFILPGIGQALSKTAGSAFRGITGALAKGGKIAQGAGKMLEAGVNFAKMGHSAFRTVTDGIGSFVKEMGGAALNQIPGLGKMLGLQDKNFSAAWNNVQDVFNQRTDEVMENFNNLIGNSKLPPTAGQAAALAEGSAITGGGTTPSPVGQTKGFDIDSYKTAETPEFIDTSELQQVDIPDNFGMDAPDISVDFGTKTETLGGGYRGQPTQSSTAGGILNKADIEIDMPEVETKSLLEKASDLVKETATRAYQEIKDAPSKIPEYVGEKVEGEVKGELMEALDLVPEYEGPEQAVYNPMAQYEEVGVGSYASAEINDRAYQMAIDPVNYGMQNPFGYPAQDFYKQQMLQFTRPQ